VLSTIKLSTIGTDENVIKRRRFLIEKSKIGGVWHKRGGGTLLLLIEERNRAGEAKKEGNSPLFLKKSFPKNILIMKKEKISNT